MQRSLMRLLIIVMTTIGTGCFTQQAMAYPSGISGYSGKTAGATCNSCHFGGLQPTVALSGPTSVTSGSTNTYTLTVTGGSQIGGGLDVAAGGGALAVLDFVYTKLMNTELTLAQPKAVDANGAVAWSFSWTAPMVSASTNYTLYGDGGSFNLDGGTSGDMSNTTTLTVNVGSAVVNQPPVANAGGPYQGVVAQAIQFDGSGSTDPENSIATYAWDFGDGSMGTAVNPTHAYASAGTFIVKLTVADTGGLSNTAQTTANIFAGATPTIIKFTAPRRVRLSAGNNTATSCSVVATVNGVASGSAVSATAYLKKNGAPYANQVISLVSGSNTTATLPCPVSSADAPLITWDANVVANGVSSQTVEKITKVIVR